MYTNWVLNGGDTIVMSRRKLGWQRQDIGPFIHALQQLNTTGTGERTIIPNEALLYLLIAAPLTML